MDDRRLRASEARFQALVAAAAQIVWATPPDGVIDDMPAWHAYTGQSVEEVRGWGWLDALHPEDRARAARLWAEALATRSVCEAEYRVCRHDGVYRSFLVRGVPVLDDDGGIREWVGLCTDVTARKQAEAALHAREEFWRTVVANAPMVRFAVDRDGIFTLSEGTTLRAAAAARAGTWCPCIVPRPQTSPLDRTAWAAPRRRAYAVAPLAGGRTSG
jgi:PAS domain S-box-containing protein